jgi:hypothetical protein
MTNHFLSNFLTNKTFSIINLCVVFNQQIMEKYNIYMTKFPTWSFFL